MKQYMKWGICSKTSKTWYFSASYQTW